MTFLPMMASAFSGEAVVDGINYLIVTKAKTAEVRALPNGKYTGDIVIPESIVYDGIECRVEKINNNAFQNCNSLLSVSIAEHYFCTSCAQAIVIGRDRKLAAEIADSIIIEGDSQFQFNGYTSLAVAEIPDTFAQNGIHHRSDFVLSTPNRIEINHRQYFLIAVSISSRCAMNEV